MLLCQYDGEWRDGRYNGKGTYWWENDDSWTGTFRDGEPHGKGTYTFAQENVATSAEAQVVERKRAEAEAEEERKAAERASGNGAKKKVKKKKGMSFAERRMQQLQASGLSGVDDDLRYRHEGEAARAAGGKAAGRKRARRGDVKRDCIYWRSRRVCWCDELAMGARVSVAARTLGLGIKRRAGAGARRTSPHRWNDGTLTDFNEKTGKHFVKFDRKNGRWLALHLEQFKLLQHNTAGPVALVQHAVDGWKPGELVVNKLRICGPSASSPMLSPAMKSGGATGGVFHDHFLLSHFNKGDKDPTLKGMIPREGGLLLPSLRQQRL